VPVLKVLPIRRHKQQQPSAAGKLNHLGIEVELSAKVAQASDRFQQAHLQVKAEPQTTCCYALQDKVWVTDPDYFNNKGGNKKFAQIYPYRLKLYLSAKKNVFL